MRRKGVRNKGKEVGRKKKRSGKKGKEENKGSTKRRKEREKIIGMGGKRRKG